MPTTIGLAAYVCWMLPLVRGLQIDILFKHNDSSGGTSSPLDQALNHTTELIGPWVSLSRYVVYIITKQPIDEGFFRATLSGDQRVTGLIVLNQIRFHQPYVYQVFEAMLVTTNGLLATLLGLFILRTMHTCGASKEQDVTINYRLLLQTYTVSAWAIMGVAIFFAVIVISCDYNMDNGLQALTLYMRNFKALLDSFLQEDMGKTASNTYRKMTQTLQHHHYVFSSAFGNLSTQAVVTAIVNRLNASTLFSSFYNETLQEVLEENITTYPVAVQQDVTILKQLAGEIDQDSRRIGRAVVDSLVDSTLFQRYGIIITVTDLLETINGQLFSFDHEISNTLRGVNSLESLLLDDENTLFFLPRIQRFLSKSIAVIMGFVALTIGGMMCGVMLGYANHKDSASPLERTKLSNTAGQILIFVSYAMLIGLILMTAFSGFIFLLGCLGEIFLCRPQRDRSFGRNPQLIDYATSLLMNASVNGYHVKKLLKFSTIQRHCQSHLGIAGLAGIHSSELEKAIGKINDLQRDLVDHYDLNLDRAVTTILERHVHVSNFSRIYRKVAQNFPDGDKKQQLIVFTTEDTRLWSFCIRNPAAFKEFVQRAFLDDTLNRCDRLKTDIVTYLDMFDNVGNCTKIIEVFETCFSIICGGFIDYVNGYWVALISLIGIYAYAIYISLVTSRYFMIMKEYTYEGEPVPEGVKFDELATHRKQKTRKRRMDHMKHTEEEMFTAGATDEEQKKMQELAEKMKALRMKKRTRIAEQAEKEQEAGLAGIAGMAGIGNINLLPVSLFPLLGTLKGGVAAVHSAESRPGTSGLKGEAKADTKGDSSSQDKRPAQENLDPEFRS